MKNNLIHVLEQTFHLMKKQYDQDWIYCHLHMKEESDRYFIHKQKYNKNEPPHQHSFMELCVVVEGNFALCMDEHIVDMEQGDACIIFPGVNHYELSVDHVPCTLLWVVIENQHVHVYLTKKDQDRRYLVLEGITMQLWGRNIGILPGKWMTEFQNKRVHYLDTIKTSVMELMVSMIRNGKRQIRSIDETKEWRNKVVVQTKEYIHQHFRQSVSLSEVSQMVGISPMHLNELFFSVTQGSIYDHLMELKTESAKNLLTDTQMPTDQIALQLGYMDGFDFEKLFKQNTGMNPLEYRQRMKDAL